MYTHDGTDCQRLGTCRFHEYFTSTLPAYGGCSLFLPSLLSSIVLLGREGDRLLKVCVYLARVESDSICYPRTKFVVHCFSKYPLYYTLWPRSSLRLPTYLLLRSIDHTSGPTCMQARWVPVEAVPPARTFLLTALCLLKASAHPVYIPEPTSNQLSEEASARCSDHLHVHSAPHSYPLPFPIRDPRGSRRSLPTFGTSTPLK